MQWGIIKKIAEQIDMYEKNKETSQNWKVVKVVNNNVCQWEEVSRPAFETIIINCNFPMAVYIKGHELSVTPIPVYSRQFDSITNNIINLTYWTILYFVWIKLLFMIIWHRLLRVLMLRVFCFVLFGLKKLESKAYHQAIDQYTGEDKWFTIRDDKLEKCL